MALLDGEADGGAEGGGGMGCVKTINWLNFPKQSGNVNRRCDVCFHYDISHGLKGTVIRDDMEEPFETLIKLDDGRVVRGKECQYSFGTVACGK